MRRGTSTSLVVLAVLVCAGCSDDPEPVSYEDQSAQALAGALAEATAAGADPSQIEVLEGSEVTFDQYQGAVDRALTCMQDAGLEVVSTQVGRLNGRDVVEYAVGAGTLPEDQVLPVKDECYATFAQFVDVFWQTATPDGLAYFERREQALREPMEQCLAGYGVDAPEGVSFRELSVLANEHLGTAPDEDCLTEIGYFTWEG